MVPTPVGDTYFKGLYFDDPTKERTYNTRNILDPITSNGREYTFEQFYAEVLGNPAFPGEQWEKTLKKLWSGSMKIGFSHTGRDEKKQRYDDVELTAVFLASAEYQEFYLKCHLQNGTVKYFNSDFIDTKILKGSTRYDLYEFLEDVLGIDY